MLHGHNYQVEVDLVCRQNDDDKSRGYAIDFHILKKLIKEMCDAWDEHVLLPQKHPDMKSKTSADGKNYEINFRDRFYSLPVKETIWLPITNTSVENLSSLLANELLQKIAPMGVLQVQVTVEETRGQSASATIQV